MEGTRTIPLSTCAAVVTLHAGQDSGQPVVEGSHMIPPTTCAVMADSSVRVDGIRPVEILTYLTSCQICERSANISN